MSPDYLRSLAPRLERYFERLAKSNRQEWNEHVVIARAFATLISRDPDEWREEARRLRQRLVQVQDGSALIEVALALDEIIAGKVEGVG